MKVIVVGYGLSGKRVVDAVNLQEDMELVGVVEFNSFARKMAEKKGCKLFSNLGEAEADIVVNCTLNKINSDKPVINVHSGSDKVPEPNNIAIKRIIDTLDKLGKVKRVFATVLSRGAHATDHNQGPIDAIQQIFGKDPEEEELKNLLPGVDVFTKRVIVSTSRSNTQIVKLDFENLIDKSKAVAALQSNNRITVASAKDGFPDTAHVVEFYRDLGRTRFDMPEVFIWEETLSTQSNSLQMVLCIYPDATSIPETIDAIRTSSGNKLPDSIAKTNESLGINGDETRGIKNGPY